MSDVAEVAEVTPVEGEVSEDIKTSDSNQFSSLADNMLVEEEDERSDLAADVGEDERNDAEKVVDDFLSPKDEASAEVVPEEKVEVEAEAEVEVAKVVPEEPAQQEVPEVPAEVVPEVKVEESPKEEPETVPAVEPDFQKVRGEALSEIEKLYEFPEEDVLALSTEPEKVLPKLAARLYMDAFENITSGIMNALPGMITNTIQVQKAAQDNETEFFGKWDGKLSATDPTHRDTVTRIANVYAQVNPSATRDRFIAEVGAQALMALGIPFEQIVDAPQEDAPVKPFAPAKPASVTPPPTAVRNDEWGGLAEEFIIDDTEG